MEVGSAFVSVLPSARGFGGKLQSEVGGEVDTAGKSVGSKFGTAMKVGALAVVGGAALLGGFLKGSIEEAREAQKVGALTNAVIKSTGGVANVTAKDVDALATSISNKTGVDDEAIAAGQNMLLTFSNVRNEVGKGNDIFSQATVAATDMAAAFGGDAVSNSKMLGKALNDPTAGVSALTRVGVSFTAQQKEQIATLQESGDVLGAQKIILGEVSKQTRGAAAASATAGEKFATTFANFKESIGTALLPVLDRLLNGLSKFVVFLTNDIAPGLRAVNGFLAPVIAKVRTFFGAMNQGATSGGRFTAAFEKVRSFIATKFLPAFNGIVQAVRGFARVALPIVQQFARGMMQRIQPLLPKIKAVFTQVGTAITLAMGLIKAVIQRVTAIIQGIWSRWGTQIMNFITRVYAQIVNIVSGALKIIQGVIRTVTGVIRGDWSQAWQGIKQIVDGAWDVIKGLVSAALDIIKTMFQAGWAVLKEIVSQAWDEIRQAVGNGIEAMLSIIRDIPGKVTAAIGNLGSTLYNAGAELVDGLINGIQSRISALGAKMSELAGKVKGFLPGSPVKEGPLTSWNRGGAGKRLVGLLADGLSDTAPVDAAMTRLTSRIASPGAPRLAAGVAAGVISGGAGRAGAAVHIENVYTRDEAAMARAVEDRHRKALAMMGSHA